ncbi:ABC transporter permease [Microbacterium sp. NPDC057659]|uniref:ABC transporter permease n=1 Tax=Microbacterium sp. NPDC057659 TaxID=3346198 RepID=UPI00366B0438
MTAPVLTAAPGGFRLRAAWDATRWQLAVLAELVVILLVWQYLQAVVGFWNPVFLPPPTQVWEALVGMSESGVLWASLLYSSGNAVVGFVIAAVFGVFTGLLLGSSKLFYDIAGGPFWTLYATPRIAFQPLLVLWMGFGNGPKILIIFLMAYFPIAISTMDGIRGVDASVVKAARVYGASRAQVFFKVQLWAALPMILTGLRMGVARAMIGIVVGEFIGGSEGLGYLIRKKAGELQLDAAIGITIMLVVIAVIGMAVLNLVKKTVAPWYIEGVVRR